VSVPDSKSSARFLSLDVFRGATIVAMILVNNPGDRSATFFQLLHSPWHGFTFADTIFPAFLWIAGFAMTLSTRARSTRGEGRAKLFSHALQRVAILFVCGLLLEGFPYFQLDHYQVTGILQKIAISYLIAYTICLFTGWRGQLSALVLLYVGYIAFMLGAVPASCTDGVWSATCNASRHLNDMLLSGHMWSTPSRNDPDGVVGSLSATSSVLLGVLCAQVFASLPPGAAAIRRLLLAALALSFAGLAASTWIPVNKILWTPSYSLLMAGLASAAFALVFWLADVRRFTEWCKPFEVFGRNALAAYILSRLGVDVLKLRIGGWSIYHDFLLHLSNPAVASFLFACLNVAAVYLIVWVMFRMRIFVKL
jgi:predicted acyltransferase